MPLVFGCIAPHGSIIPGAPGSEQCAATTAAMREIGRRMESAAPNTVLVVTPHGVRVDGAMAISLSERAAGTLEDPIIVEGATRDVSVDLAVDQRLARAILDRAAAVSIPAAGVHYGATSGPHDCYPLDWGAVVPLWFLGAHFAQPPSVVVVVPSRVLPLDALARFGSVVASVAQDSASRVALIASADQAHAHSEEGPYGYDPAAAEFDEWMVAAIKEGELAGLAHANMDLVGRACPDALWQTLVLAGALERVPMRGELLSYERPSYYGMLTATYMLG
jgi:aromatic ring-opening dioxygenase LigB subunit